MKPFIQIQYFQPLIIKWNTPVGMQLSTPTLVPEVIEGGCKAPNSDTHAADCMETRGLDFWFRAGVMVYARG